VQHGRDQQGQFTALRFALGRKTLAQFTSDTFGLQRRAV
jgi:hypothetical protein